MNNMPLISVIIPAYNVEKYIKRCLDSIINQTYKNLEIIVVNDGSTDDTKAIIEDYAQKDSRIRIINKENAGVSCARNTGLDIASGEYIGFVDSDDYIEPDCYETLLNACLKHNAQMGIMAYKEFSDSSKTLNNMSYSGKTVVYNKVQAINAYVRDDCEYRIYHSVWIRLFKKEVIENLSFPEGKLAEEIMLVTRATCMLDTCVYIDKPLYNYYVGREDGLISTTQYEKRLTDEIPALIERINYLHDNNFLESEDYARYFFYRQLLFYYLEYRDNKMTKEADSVAHLIKSDKNIIKVIYEKPFAKTGDKVRIKLFLLSPFMYWVFAKIYDRVIIPIRNMR